MEGTLFHNAGTLKGNDNTERLAYMALVRLTLECGAVCWDLTECGAVCWDLTEKVR
jgi:hypothetical protein